MALCRPECAHERHSTDSSSPQGHRLSNGLLLELRHADEIELLTDDCAAAFPDPLRLFLLAMEILMR